MLQRRSATPILRQTSCIVYKGQLRSVPGWLGSFCCTCWGVYLFANGGQMVSLRWLAIFRDFERARTTNWGQACLAYFYSSLDTLSRGTLRQLVGPWKLLEVSFFPFSLVAHAFPSLGLYIHMPFRLRLCTIFLLTAFIPISCKLLPCKLPYLCLANCTITSCKLSSCELSYMHLANCHGLLQTVP